jgi:hypothetical protein
VSRRSEVLPYSGEQSGDGDRCEGDKDRRNQVIDHNTNDSTAGSSTDERICRRPFNLLCQDPRTTRAIRGD